MGNQWRRSTGKNTFVSIHGVSLCGFTQRAYSLDARADTTSSAEPGMIPVWSYRLFQVQLCAVYFFSGLAKAGKVDWQNGQAMDIVFRQTDSWMRLDLGLADYPALTALLTTTTLLFELVFFPLLVWFRSTTVDSGCGRGVSRIHRGHHEGIYFYRSNDSLLLRLLERTRSAHLCYLRTEPVSSPNRPYTGARRLKTAHLRC